MKRYGVYIMGVLYVLAGVNHFINPDFYTKMISAFLPCPRLLVYLSGVAEIVLGTGIMVSATRKISAWGIIALLIAVYPGNIYMAMHYTEWGANPWPFYLRLPIQFLLIYWAYVYTKVRGEK